MKFEARDYQKFIINSIKSDSKKILAILPRRSGKDITAWNLCINECLKKKSTIYFFTFNCHAHRALNDKTINGNSLIDYIPEEEIYAINYRKDQSLSKIIFKNQSQFIIDSISNFDLTELEFNIDGIVFSEYGLPPYKENICKKIIEKLKSDGWILYITTPQKTNHYINLYNEANNNKEYVIIKLTCEDTKHISITELEEMKKDISEIFFKQEFYCELDIK